MVKQDTDLFTVSKDGPHAGRAIDRVMSAVV